MSKCLRADCNNEVVQSGKKPRKYCSANCKQIVWQKGRKGNSEAENGLKIEHYKEGGLYRFENGGFVEEKIFIPPLTAAIHGVYVDGNVVKKLPLPDDAMGSTILPDSKDGKIIMNDGSLANPSADFKKTVAAIDKLINTPKVVKVKDLNEEASKTNRTINTKAEKEMPAGLDKSAKLRWMRENS